MLLAAARLQKPVACESDSIGEGIPDRDLEDARRASIAINETHNSSRERIYARACVRARECARELREDRRVRATRSVASIRACHSNRYQRTLRRAESSYFIAMNGKCSPHAGVLSTSCNPIRHAAL